MMNMKNFIKLNTFFVLLFFSMLVYAHDEETLFNVVHLQAESEQEIPNDQMTTVLVAEHEGSDATEIAKMVNGDMDWALGIIKQKDDVDSKTTNYQTFPVYNKQQIIAWRASQSVEIRSRNIEELSKLVGILQERLQVRQMYFSPTDETRKQYEDKLIEEALQEFKSRVQIIKKHMDNMDHRIINISVNTGGGMPPVIYADTRMKTMAMEAAPAVEAGTSKITVTVNGSVQFF